MRKRREKRKGKGKKRSETEKIGRQQTGEEEKKTRKEKIIKEGENKRKQRRIERGERKKMGGSNLDLERRRRKRRFMHNNVIHMEIKIKNNGSLIIKKNKPTLTNINYENGHNVLTVLGNKTAL